MDMKLSMLRNPRARLLISCILLFMLSTKLEVSQVSWQIRFWTL